MPRMHNLPRDRGRIPPELLAKYGLSALHQVMVTVQRETTSPVQRARMLEELKTSKIDNITRYVDQLAEFSAAAQLKKFFRNTKYRDSLDIWGEETINDRKDLTFHECDRTVALLDMVDGTDLLNRGMGNWCSAIVFFYPPEKEVLASIVGLPSREFYVAEKDKAPYKVILKSDAQEIPAEQILRKFELQITDQGPSLDESGVCFYGQKAKNLLSVFGNRFPESVQKTVGGSGFGDYLAEIHSSKPPFRIYTLGGNPMMARVADGNVHAVFELLGQKPHDVVPGAFLAHQAGAVVRDLEGRTLDLGTALMEPNKSDMKYVIAATEALYSELVKRLKSEPSGSTPGSISAI